MTLISIRERGTLTTGPVIAIDGQEYAVTLTDPFTPADEQLLAWYFEQYTQYANLKPAAARKAANSINRYGEALFNQLFADRNAYALYGAARQAGLSTLAIEVIGSPAFQRWHWEALRDPNLPQPLALGSALVRRNIKPQVIQAQAQASPTLNVLLVTARPYGPSDPAYRTISRPLVQTLRQTSRPIRLHLLRPGTYAALLHHLEQTQDAHGAGYYHILHLDVHGALLTFDQLSQGSYLRQARYGRADFQTYAGLRAYLHLESAASAQADLVEAQELANLLLAHQIPIVLLNACQSGQQVGTDDTSLGSYLMAAGVQQVLALRYAVTVSAAQILMQSLYEQISDGRPFTSAVRRARQELSNRKSRRDALNQPFDLEDWLLPVVYQNRDVQLTLRDFTPTERAAYYQTRAAAYQPPAPVYPFVGRDLEILQIERLLLTQRNLLLLHGATGIGKTTLLHHLGWWWQTTGLVQTVFYISYHEQPWACPQIVEQMARHLFDEGVYVSQFKALGQPHTQQAFLLAHLRPTTHLLLLDGLEAVPAATRPELIRFLTDLVDAKTLVLIAARDELTWLPPGLLANNRLALPPLDAEAAANLAGHILARYHVSHLVDDPHFATLCQQLAGHPGALTTVLPNLAHQRPEQILTHLTSTGGEI